MLIGKTMKTHDDKKELHTGEFSDTTGVMTTRRRV
jgi:hypothetical protein